MANAYELRPGSQPRADYKGSRTASRRFLVDVTPDLVPLDGSIVGLPAINSSHPTIPGARADLIEASEVPGKKDWAYADVLYSTERKFGFPKQPIATNELTFKSWGMEPLTVDRAIPVAKKITRSVPSPSGGAPTTVTTWGYGPDFTVSYFETVPIVIRKVVLSTFDSSIWNAIIEQNNKIHVLPDGLPYRFEAGAITQTTATAWETTYSWYGDTGSVAPKLINPANLNNADIIYPPGLPGFFYSRSAFGVWQVVHNPLNPWPKFIETFPYDDDTPGGWSTLPGDPI